MTTPGSSSIQWVAVVPVKHLARAKSRFSARPANERAALALAFAVDTVHMAMRCQDFVEVIVVTSDPVVRHAVEKLGCTWIADEPDSGLNAAFDRGSAHARLTRSGVAIAALAGDLPAVRSDELSRAVRAAAAVERGFIADAAGTGTTLLTALPGIELDPHFGPRSRAAHAASGAIALEPGLTPGLRRDVDTEVDLWDAVRLGLGAATAALALGT